MTRIYEIRVIIIILGLTFRELFPGALEPETRSSGFSSHIWRIICKAVRKKGRLHSQNERPSLFFEQQGGGGGEGKLFQSVVVGHSCMCK